ncbi:MAG TPA: hypothetical protein VL404_05795 [Candidatus Eisenbacteria bacterium]|nr:hypothetical protein [Candidatus Eisenbacteria bacterium]
MENIEEFQFRADKVYCLYYGPDCTVARFVKKTRLNDQLYFVFMPADDGFGSGKKLLLQAKVIFQIIEFDTIEEYQEHYDQWKDERQSGKFSGDEDY